MGHTRYNEVATKGGVAGCVGECVCGGVDKWHAILCLSSNSSSDSDFGFGFRVSGLGFWVEVQVQFGFGFGFWDQCLLPQRSHEIGHLG